MTDLRQTPAYASYMASCGWIVGKVPPFSFPRQPHSHRRPSTFVYIKKLPLLPFSVMKIQRSSLPDFRAVDRLCRAHRAVFIAIEPRIIRGLSVSEVAAIFQQHGYRQASIPMLPTRTLQIDLRQSPKDLFRTFKKDARTSIRKTLHSCRFRVLDPQDEAQRAQFYSFWKTYGRGFVFSVSNFQKLLAAFGSDSFFVCTYTGKGQLLAASLILVHNKSASYYFACVSPLGRLLTSRVSMTNASLVFDDGRVFRSLSRSSGERRLSTPAPSPVFLSLYFLNCFVIFAAKNSTGA